MEAKQFGAFLTACMKSALGRKDGVPWTPALLAGQLDVDEKTIRNWQADKHLPPDKSLALLATAFGFSRIGKTDLEILDEESYRNLYRSAGKAIIPGLTRPMPPAPPESPTAADQVQSTRSLSSVVIDAPLSALPGLLAFPTGLPSNLPERVKLLAGELSRYLSTPAQRPHRLSPLPVRLDLAALHGGDLNTPDLAADSIIQLAKAIDQCNESMWFGTKVPGAERRDACGRLMMLLTALAWTEDGWRKLQDLGHAPRGDRRIQQLRNPQLIQAGVHAAAGDSLQVTFDRNWLRDQRPGMASDMPPSEVWHLAVGGANAEVNPGVGLDYQEFLLKALASVFAVPFPAMQADRRKAQLDEFRDKLRARIRRHTLRCFNADSRFMLSRLMPPDATDEVALLYEHATQLSCTPLAYTGTSGQLVHGDEEELIASIEECVDAIARIQDLPR